MTTETMVVNDKVIVNPRVRKTPVVDPVLKKLANDAGVEAVRCDKEWGGTWGYRVKDKGPGAYNVNGFRNEAAVYKSWAESQFGKAALKALMRSLQAEARLTYIVESLWFGGAGKETCDACFQALSPKELIAFVDARLREGPK